MKISIIIPLYESRPYIAECLASIAVQTYNGIMECIIVDDKGSDGSIEVAKEYIRNYNGNIKFRTIQHTTNRGAAAARNTGLDAATGDYIFYIDSDDLITPTCIEEIVNHLHKHPTADIVQAGMQTTDGSIPWFDLEKNPLPEYTDDIYEIKTQLLGREIIPASAVNKLIPTRFLKEHNIYFHEGIVIEDVLWCNILAKHVKSIACLNKNTYIYRIRKGSVVTSGLGVDPMRKLIVYDLMIDKIDKPYTKEQTKHLINQTDKVYFEHPTSEVRKKAGKLYLKLAKHCNISEKIRLTIKSICAKHDKGNKSLAYYTFYLVTENKSLPRAISAIVKKLIARK